MSPLPLTTPAPLRESRRRCTARASRRLPATALAMVLAALAPAHTALADVDGDIELAALEPLEGSELADLRGGFRVGGYEFALGAVVKTVVAGAAGQLFELVSTFSVPEIGALTHLGTTITPGAATSGTSGGTGSQTAPATPTASTPAASTPTAGTPAPTPAAAPAPLAAPPASALPTSVPTGTAISLPGTTIISQGLFNTFIENTALDRVITQQTDLNLQISGLAQQALRLDAAKLGRIAGDAQVLFAGR